MDPPGILAQLTALADATRTRLLLVLERQELTVGELCQVLQLPQSTVSRHLKTLADEGWVAARADGASRRYRAATLDPSARRLWRVVREQVAESAAARHDAHRLEGVLAQRRSASEEFFATAAGRWDALRVELFGRGADQYALLGLLDDGWTVGDLGCGTGSVAVALAPFVRRVVAVDASPAMLAAAAERLRGARGVELRAGALERLPVADGELDAAVFSLVLHYVPDPAAALAEARRALRPGGRLLVVDMVPHEREEYRAEMGHAWLGFDEEQLAAWLAEAGFDRVRYQPLPADPAARGPALFTATARARSGEAADVRG
jgi:SAM-dependent methyltransferase